jgi:predicted nucleic acid-binding protein
MTDTWFLDTGFVIALVSPRDNHHVVAQNLFRSIEENGISLVTSQAVVLEVGAALSKQPFRRAAVNIIDVLQTDPQIEIVAVDAALLDRGFDLFKKRADKEWSLADCVSFEIMRDRGISDALSTDAHFTQAGFTALLRR